MKHITVILLVALLVMPPELRAQWLGQRKQITKAEALLVAARQGNLPKVKELVADGVNINAFQPGPRWTVLHEAIKSQNLAVTEFVLSQNPSIEAKALLAVTPLCTASQYSSADIVRLLIKSRARVNVVCEEGFSPLQQAVMNNSKGVAIALLEGGADVNYVNSQFKTALNLCKNDEICNILTSHNAAKFSGLPPASIVYYLIPTLIFAVVTAIVVLKRTRGRLSIVTGYRSVHASDEESPPVR